MAEADTVKNTQTKLNYYRAAIVAARDCHCPDLEQSAYNQIDTLFILIEEEKRKAEVQAQMILEQQDKLKSTLIETEAANDKNIKIINAMDFYDGKFALAFKNGKYGFIDKEGNTKLDFEYDKGAPFDLRTSFAEMEIIDESTNKGVTYLIDTIGNRYQLFHITEEYLMLLKKKLAKDKAGSKLEGKEFNLNSINEVLAYNLSKNEEKIALEFYNVKKTDVLSVLHYLTKDSKIYDRIEVLTLNVSKLNKFPDLILEFKNIKYIDIQWTSIGLLPKAINNLKSLKIFKLPLFLKKLPSSIYNLDNLEALDLYSTDLNIKQLPKTITNLIKLRKLTLPESLEILPESIGDLKSLEILELFQTEVTELPESIGSLKNLEILDLSITGVKELPETIGKLGNLKELYLNRTKVKAIPEAIGNLKNLKILKLPEKLKKVPSSIYDLNKLEILDIYGINQKELPETIANLKNLKRLSIQAPIDNIPSGICNLENLEVLTLEGMKRTIRLPDAIGKLKNLKELYILFSLETLPESIGSLISLEELMLHETELKKLPEGISKLVNLSELSLPPSLELFPESIGNLINLKGLYIEDNPHFKNVPDISKLKKLKDFYFTLYKNENYDVNLKKLKELQRKLPECDFDIKNENGNAINVKEE
jgi:internalin A